MPYDTTNKSINDYGGGNLNDYQDFWEIPVLGGGGVEGGVSGPSTMLMSYIPFNVSKHKALEYIWFRGGCLNVFYDIWPISVFGYSGPSPRLMTYFFDIPWHKKQEYIGNEIRIQCVLRLGNFLFYWGWWVIMTYWFRNQVPHVLPVTVNICFQRQHVSIFDCSQVITIYIVTLSPIWNQIAQLDMQANHSLEFYIISFAVLEYHDGKVQCSLYYHIENVVSWKSEISHWFSTWHTVFSFFYFFISVKTWKL